MKSVQPAEALSTLVAAMMQPGPGAKSPAGVHDFGAWLESEAGSEDLQDEGDDPSDALLADVPVAMPLEARPQTALHAELVGISAQGAEEFRSLGSHPQSGDPRRVFVDGEGDLGHPTDRGPTAREPDLSARGLRLGSARPGGAGAESFRIQSRRTLSGSRGFPPPEPAAVGQPETSEPPREGALPDGVDTLETIQLEGLDPDAETRPEPAAEPRMEAKRRPQASSTPRRMSHSTTPQSTDLVLDGADVLQDELDLERVERPSESAELAPETEAPLPPARPDSAPARIRVDSDLTVEVDVDDLSVEVTVEGRSEATDPLSDLGRELEDALRKDGFDLDSFGQRRRSGERRVELYRPRTRLTPAAATDTPDPDRSQRPRADGTGRHVDILI